MIKLLDWSNAAGRSPFRVALDSTGVTDLYVPGAIARTRGHA